MGIEISEDNTAQHIWSSFSYRNPQIAQKEIERRSPVVHLRARLALLHRPLDGGLRQSLRQLSILFFGPQAMNQALRRSRHPGSYQGL